MLTWTVTRCRMLHMTCYNLCHANFKVRKRRTGRTRFRNLLSSRTCSRPLRNSNTHNSSILSRTSLHNRTHRTSSPIPCVSCR